MASTATDRILIEAETDETGVLRALYGGADSLRSADLATCTVDVSLSVDFSTGAIAIAVETDEAGDIHDTLPTGRYRRAQEEKDLRRRQTVAGEYGTEIHYSRTVKVKEGEIDELLADFLQLGELLPQPWADDDDTITGGPEQPRLQQVIPVGPHGTSALKVLQLTYVEMVPLAAAKVGYMATRTLDPVADSQNEQSIVKYGVAATRTAYGIPKKGQRASFYANGDLAVCIERRFIADPPHGRVIVQTAWQRLIRWTKPEW